MKKILSMILLIIIMTSVITPIALAESTQISDEVLVEVTKDIEIANEKIGFEVQKARIKAHILKVRYRYNEEKFEKKFDVLIEKLIKDTNRIAKKAIKKAAKNGVTVECELKPYKILDREVLIDPLRVVAF